MAIPDPTLLDQLRTVEIFADLPDEQLGWFIEGSELQDAEVGEIVFVEGEPADTMFVLLTGEIHGRREQDGRIFAFAAGDLSGVLPFSRMKEWGGTGRAIVPSRLLRFPKEKFAELLDRIPVLEPRLVAYMTDRVRDFTRREQQEEKLISLGRLSAGLAHELNNPAAAAQRAAAGLGDAFCEAQRWTARLARRVDPEVMERLPELPLTLDPAAASKLDPLARSDREDEITDWLDAQGAEDTWRIAPTLVEAGADLPWLERFGEGIPPEELPFALAWLEVTLRAEELLNTIEQATGRISNLVGDVKRYTYMDRAPVQEVDVREGLDTTLRVLAHKLQGITTTREYAPGLPTIPAHGGELNQVWTNLLDNAADAVGEGGLIVVRTLDGGDAVCVEIVDNGPGIPPEVQNRIFDPFFTTKEVGSGTGLGLDIARRIVEQHGGSIRVDSGPGETRFVVRLPVNGSAHAG